MATKVEAYLDRELKKKMKLEIPFKKEIRKLFNSIRIDFMVNVAGSGNVPSSELFTTRWEAILKNHYERVQKAFTFINFIERNRTAIEKEEDEESISSLLLLLSQWKEETAKESAGHITDTTNKNMRDALVEAREILTEEGATITNRTLAALAATLLRRKFNGRVDKIAMIETQDSSENTKEEVSKKIIADIVKIWRNVGDNLVRLTHIIADGQTRLPTFPFTVGGESLMFPGDRSLGATAKEWANCRCSSVTFAGGALLEFA